MRIKILLLKRKKLCTGDNLLFMTQKIQENLNRGKKVCAIHIYSFGRLRPFSLER